MPRNPERPDEWILNDEVMACCQGDGQRLGPEEDEDEDAKLTEQNKLRNLIYNNVSMHQTSFGQYGSNIMREW
jgi:hypothetical protein